MRYVTRGAYRIALVLTGLAWGCGNTDNPSSRVSPTGTGASASGGSAAGGMTIALGGAGGTMTALGGTGGGPSAGAGGEAVRAEGAAQWIVFTTPDGFYAYDAHNYPAENAAIRLGETTSNSLTGTYGPDWSPDGKHVAGVTGDSLVVWDMSGVTPSTGTVLVTGLKRGGDAVTTQWAADNRILFLKQDKTLVALDSRVAMPEQRVITSSVLFFSRAPQGDGLIYDDDSGMNFVHVPGGVPGQPQHVEELSADWQWSPDGVHFGTEGQSVKIFDTGGAELVSTDVLALMRMFAASPSFSGDGSHFAFNAGDGTGTLMYGSVAAPASVKPLNGAMAGSEGRASRWHPSKPSIAYNVAYPPAFQATGEWVVADVSGAEPGAPVAIPVAGVFDGWLDADRLLMIDEPHQQLTLVDMAAKPPSAAPFTAVPEGGIAYESVSPDGKVLAFATEAKLYFADMSAPATPPLSVSPGGQDDGLPYFAWTADGKYLVVNVESDKFTKASLKLARIEGQKLSPLVTIMPPRPVQGFGWALQPAPRN
jgi:hypothetical protein